MDDIRAVMDAAGGECVLATILFTDLVGSTETVRRLGDDVWARVLESHHAVRASASATRGHWSSRAC